jgi:hypothetical protein
MVPSGVAGRFNGVLAPALEPAPGGDLVVDRVQEQIYRQSAATIYHISTSDYHIEEGQPLSDDLSAMILEALESQGGSVTVHPASTIALILEAEGLKAGGLREGRVSNMDMTSSTAPAGSESL